MSSLFLKVHSLADEVAQLNSIHLSLFVSKSLHKPLGNSMYCCSETVKEPLMEFDLRFERCHTAAYSLRQTWQACSNYNSALATIHHGKMADTVQIDWHKCPCFFSARGSEPIVELTWLPTIRHDDIVLFLCWRPPSKEFS